MRRSKASALQNNGFCGGLLCLCPASSKPPVWAPAPQAVIIVLHLAMTRSDVALAFSLFALSSAFTTAAGESQVKAPSVS